MTDRKKKPGKARKPQAIRSFPPSYQKNHSKTLSNTSVVQLIKIGSYKKRINALSRNNRHLATALQEARLEAAIQENIVKDCAKYWNNILLAHNKLIEMIKNFAKFGTDLEKVREYLNVACPLEKPFTHGKRLPCDKLREEPAKNCIEEVTNEDSVNEVVPSENVSISADNIIPDKSEDNKPDVGLSNQGSNVDIEKIEIAPILFADGSEEKKKKCKDSSDPDKGSLTPKLSVDLTSVKLRRNSSGRHIEVFQFPASRSTSRGKASSIGKENSPKELATPEKPPSPTFAQQKQTQEEIYKITTDNNIEENGLVDVKNKTKENNNMEIISEKVSQTIFSAHPDIPEVLNNDDVQLPEINEDDEVQNVASITFCMSNVKDKHIESNANISSRKLRGKPVNYAIYFSSDKSDEDSPIKITTKAASKCKNVVSAKSNKTSENPEDPVKIVNSTKPSKTFEKTEDPVKTVNSTKPCKNSEKTGDHVKTISSTKPSKTSEKTADSIKTVNPCNIGKSSEKTEDHITCHKVQLENKIKKDLLACSVDILHSKKVEKKSSKKSKDMKSSIKDDLLKHSAISKSKNLKLDKHVKKLGPHQEDIKSPINENVRKLVFNPDLSSPSILKKTQPNFQATKETGFNTLLNKVVCNDNLDNSLINELESPKSDTKKVSFAPSDTVCDDDSNNTNDMIVKTHKKVLQEQDMNIIQESSSQNNHSKKSSTKKQSKVKGKASMEKVSDYIESAPEIKRGRLVAVSGLLKNALNLPEVQDEVPLKRRKKPVNYKELSP